MRRVGLVTLWKANYGSQLQCFATKRIFSDLGYECILIEAKASSTLERLFFGLRNRLFRYILIIKNWKERKKIINVIQAGKRQANGQTTKKQSDFIKNQLSPHYYTRKLLNQIGKDADFKFFLSGSDQVWNGASTDYQIMGFLNFAPERKRVAFAPSLGGDEILKYNYRRFCKAINGFHILSAREKPMALNIERITSRKCTWLLDPVLQLSVNEWESILNEFKVPRYEQSHYVVAYFLDEPDKNASVFLKGYCDGHEVVVYSLPLLRKDMLADCCEFNGGPLELIRLFQDAEYIITDSFHATALAIMYHRPFIVYDRQYGHEYNQKSRVKSLLSLCGLESRMYSKNTIISDAPINFQIADEHLERQRDVAKTFLATIIDEFEER